MSLAVALIPALSLRCLYFPGESVISPSDVPLVEEQTSPASGAAPAALAPPPRDVSVALCGAFGLWITAHR
jgi:hypothetical protein